MEGPGGLRVQLLSYAFSRKARITTSKGGFGLPFFVSSAARLFCDVLAFRAGMPQGRSSQWRSGCVPVGSACFPYVVLNFCFYNGKACCSALLVKKNACCKCQRPVSVTQGIMPLRVTISFGENECRARDGLDGHYAACDCAFNFSNNCH